MNNLYYNIFIPIIIAIIMNASIYLLGWNKDDDMKYKKSILPPGYVIGIIWIIIFGLLGYSHYLLYNINNRISLGSISIIFVILFCLSYPIITKLKFKNGLLLNLITLILSFILGLIVIIESKYVFLYIIPLIVWSCYVNISDVLLFRI
jgi:tryptophan-rich sensory protein